MHSLHPPSRYLFLIAFWITWLIVETFISESSRTLVNILRGVAVARTTEHRSMFSSSQSTMFPPELIEHVFSFLREQKYYGLKAHPADVTLKACAMDPFLSSFAARYFYASLTLHNRDNNAQPNSLTTSSFSRLFSANPHIAEYVRDLRMAFGGGTPDEQFEAILPKLHRLESIGIVGHWFNPVNWDALPDGFRYAFLACIHRPSIKMVSLENISRFPLETLENSEISSLVLNTCTLFGTSQRPDPSAYHPSLESLTFDHVMFRSSFDDWAKRSAHSLRSLSFRLDTTDDTFVLQSLLPICSNSLACLRIDLVNNCRLLYRLPVSYLTCTPQFGQSATTPKNRLILQRIFRFRSRFLFFLISESLRLVQKYAWLSLPFPIFVNYSARRLNTWHIQSFVCASTVWTRTLVAFLPWTGHPSSAFLRFLLTPSSKSFFTWLSKSAAMLKKIKFWVRSSTREISQGS